MKKLITLTLTIFSPLILLNCGSSSSNTPKKVEDNRTSSTKVETYITLKSKLPDEIKESSGLIHIDNQLWTHNDSGHSPQLYQIDKKNGKILKTVTITNANNIDWEDLTYDENYVYIGDFGNNNGDRKDLRIYKIPRENLKSESSIRAEHIYFSYSDQTDFTSKPFKNDFDCEAMVENEGKLYLFSKNWETLKTRLYELETTTGTHVAKYINTFNTKSLVSGATLNKELNILLLSSYTFSTQGPNLKIWAFSNYTNNNFFNGTAKQLTLANPLNTQVEGITFTDNYKAYLSSEFFFHTTISLNPNLYELNFSKEFR